MLSFTVVRSSKSGHCYVYNETGFELAYVDSLSEVFNYFYKWSVSLGSKSVTYSFTKDKNTILVKIN